MTLKVKKIDILFFILAGSVVFLPFYFKTKYLGYSLAGINVIFWMPFIIYLSKHQKYLHKNWIYYIYIFYLICSFVSSFIYSRDFNYSFRLNLIMTLPILLLFIELDNSSVKRMITISRAVYMIMLYLVTLGGVIDLITHRSVSMFFANFYKDTSSYVLQMASGGRLVSFLGHPLTNALFYIVGYVYTCLYNFWVEKKAKTFLPDVICIFIGIALTGSKSAFLIISLITIIFFISSKKIKYLLLLLTFFIFLYSIGAFNIVLERLQLSIASNDITTSRMAGLNELIGTANFKFFWTHGNVVNENDWRYRAALEFSIIGWAYRYGIVFAIVHTIFLFIFPLTVLIRKNKELFILAIALVIFVNTNNGISTMCDDLLIYTLCVFSMMNTVKLSSKYFNEKRSKYEKKN